MVGTVLAITIAPVMSFAGSASTNLNVSASVVANCTISTADLGFGSYDPVVAHASSPLDGTGTVTIACTKGSVTTVDLGLGSNPSGTTRRMSDGTEFLTYELYQDSSRTVVWGSGASTRNTGTAANKSPQPFTVWGRIAAGQDVTVGSYTDTVLATVNF